MISLAKQNLEGDRRSHRRYDLDLRLTFRQVAGSKTLAQGTGRLGDISSGGARFMTSAPPAIGASIELFVDWPYRGDDGSLLHLLLCGRVVRRDGSSVAVQISRHKFRSVKASTEAAFREARRHAAIDPMDATPIPAKRDRTLPDLYVKAR